MAPMESTWAELAARGAGLKYYQPIKRRSADAPVSAYPLVSSIMYEDDDLKSQIVASKAMAIVQQALTSGSVLFSFRKGIFGDRVDAYKAIQAQVSPKVEFRPLSDYDDKNDGSLLLEAKFEEATAANKAMNEGVNIGGIVYKAVFAHESKEFGELKHVQFTLMRIIKEPTFLRDLMVSLSYYGRVLQVKQFTRGGFFEGKFSVMLDTSETDQVEGEMQEAKPLDRMLYLSEFDCFVAATYKGAPPVCHFCKHSGHIRAKCPELAKRRCFRCGQQGHMLRFCPEAGKQAEYAKRQKVDTPHDGAAEEVEKAREAVAQVLDLITNEKLGESKIADESVEDEDTGLGMEEDNYEGEHSDNGSVVGEDMDLHSDDNSDQVTMEEVKDLVEEDTVVLPGKGSAYSKYASAAVAMNMNVDSPQEMLTLTTLRQNTERKRAAFDAKLQQGSKATAYNGNVKTGHTAANGGVSGAKSKKAGTSGGSKAAGNLPTKTKHNAPRAQ